MISAGVVTVTGMSGDTSEKRQMLFTTARQDGRLAKREDAQLGLRFVFLWCEICFSLRLYSYPWLFLYL